MLDCVMKIRTSRNNNEKPTSNLMRAILDGRDYEARKTTMGCREFVIDFISGITYQFYLARTYSYEIKLSQYVIINIDTFGEGPYPNIENLIMCKIFGDTGRKPAIVMDEHGYTVEFKLKWTEPQSSPGIISLVMFLLIHGVVLDPIYEKHGKDGVITYILDTHNELFNKDSSDLRKYNSILTAFGLYTGIDSLPSWSNTFSNLPNGIVSSYLTTPSLFCNPNTRSKFLSFIDEFDVDTGQLDKFGLPISKLIEIYKKDSTW